MSIVLTLSPVTGITLETTLVGFERLPGLRPNLDLDTEFIVKKVLILDRVIAMMVWGMRPR